MPDPIPLFLDDSDAVVALADELARRCPPGGRLALDTEFHTERRFHPELLLLQLALPDGACWLIDPTRADLTPLAPVLADRAWVAHGAQADVSILHAVLGIRPAALWDTQALGGLCGLGYPRRLEDLTTAVLGDAGPPGATLTDWSQRPLTAAQLRYAAADAHLALRLVDALEPTLDDRRRGWWAAIGAERVAEAVAPQDPDRSWMRLGIAPTLDTRTRQVLAELCRWRDEEAALRDRPPGYILPEAVLLDVARRRPSTVAELAENRRASQGLLRKHGRTVLDRIARSRDRPVPPPLQPAEVRCAAALQTLAQALEADGGIAADLALPRPLSWAVAQGGTSALIGWRREFLAAPIEAFLAGSTGLIWTGQDLRLKGIEGDP